MSASPSFPVRPARTPPPPPPPPPTPLTARCGLAGVGVRHYYRKLGYRLEGPYMVKELQAPPQSATDLVQALLPLS